MAKLIKISSNMVQLNTENQIDREDLNESFASLLLNPYVSWAKFVLTDDEPNGNGKRVPKEEFGNLINSGVYMPIKMTVGEIQGHEAAVPIGVITHLKEVKNRIEGLAALWNSERPEDVGLLKEMYENEESLNLSWEIGYTEAKESAEYDDTVDLFGTRLKAVTLVEVPAYGGRTPILALSEEEDTLEKKELLTKIEKLEDSLSKAQDENKKLLTKLEEAESDDEELLEELESLREFKAEIEQEREREERLQEIKERFEEAGIEKDDEYFEEYSETLLSMDEESFEFFLQEMASFGEIHDENSEMDDEEDNDSVPRIFGKGDPSKDEIIEYLKSGEEK